MYIICYIMKLNEYIVFKAFKFEDITKALMRLSFYYLKYYKGESDLFSVSQIEV